MTIDEFRQSLTATDPAAGLGIALAALWLDGKGDWKRAHESAQQDEGRDGSWVHPYLHRRKATRATPRIGTGGRQARVRGATGYGMAEHCGSIVAIEQGARPFCMCC